jgi:molecular chaperone DnaK
MIKDAEANAEDDIKKRDLIVARNAADNIVHQTRKDMSEVESVLTEDQKTSIKNSIDAVEAAVAGDDKAAIDSALNDLVNASQVIQEAKVKTEGSKESSDEGVVDAEFTEVKS